MRSLLVAILLLCITASVSAQYFGGRRDRHHRHSHSHSDEYHRRHHHHHHHHHHGSYGGEFGRGFGPAPFQGGGPGLGGIYGPHGGPLGFGQYGHQIHGRK